MMTPLGDLSTQGDFRPHRRGWLWAANTGQRRHLGTTRMSGTFTSNSPWIGHLKTCVAIVSLSTPQRTAILRGAFHAVPNCTGPTWKRKRIASYYVYAPCMLQTEELERVLSHRSSPPGCTDVKQCAVCTLPSLNLLRRRIVAQRTIRGKLTSERVIGLQPFAVFQDLTPSCHRPPRQSRHATDSLPRRPQRLDRTLYESPTSQRPTPTP